MRPTKKHRKKPKFLSLRLQLSSSTTMPTSTTVAAATVENSVLDPQDHKDNALQDQDNMAYLFASADEGGPAARTLMGLLTAASPANEEAAGEVGSLSPSTASSVLMKAAMRRSKDRETWDQEEEEKWVCISEVMVERKAADMEEVSSAVADTAERQWGTAGLALKLDYEEVLNAWCEKGRPLYIETECPQTVPDLGDDFVFNNNNVSGGHGMWRVPESSKKGMEERDGGGGGGGQREASVLRYKAKRQARLFSKRIRYQVRKLNAEMRPRIKGRFVKRT